MDSWPTSFDHSMGHYGAVGGKYGGEKFDPASFNECYTLIMTRLQIRLTQAYEGIEMDWDDEDDWSDDDTTHLALRNYVENKHDQGINPPLKNVRSLQVCRDAGLNCREVRDILQQLGFTLEDNEDKVLSDLLILPANFLASQAPLRN